MGKLYKYVSFLIVVSVLAACSFPSWNTYVNHAYGFELQYPTAGSIDPGATDTAVRIQLPFTPGTNLVEKFLDIAVQTGVSTCESPYAAGYTPGSLTPTTQVINGLTWVEESSSEGAAGSRYDWTAYSTVNGIVCVSLTFILHSHPPELFPTPPPTFNQSAESAVFLLIVDTFQWLKGGATTPTGLPLIPLSRPASSSTPTEVSTAPATPTSPATPTPVPSSTMTATPVPGLSFLPRIDPKKFNYQRDCKPLNPKIDIVVSLNGSSKVNSVILFFRLKNQTTNALTPWNNGVVMKYQGNGIYDLSIMWNQIPGLSNMAQSGASYWFEYQFVATDAQSNILGRSPVYSDIALTPCR